MIYNNDSVHLIRIANSARIVSSVAILLTNPLQFYAALSILIPTLGLKEMKWPLIAEYAVRYTVVIASCKQ